MFSMSGRSIQGLRRGKAGGVWGRDISPPVHLSESGASPELKAICGRRGRVKFSALSTQKNVWSREHSLALTSVLASAASTTTQKTHIPNNPASTHAFSKPYALPRCSHCLAFTSLSKGRAHVHVSCPSCSLTKDVSGPM